MKIGVAGAGGCVNIYTPCERLHESTVYTIISDWVHGFGRLEVYVRGSKMKAVQSAAVGGRLLQNRRLRAQLLLFSGIILVYLIFNGVLDGRLLTATNLRIILSHAVFPRWLPGV